MRTFPDLSDLLGDLNQAGAHPALFPFSFPRYLRAFRPLFVRCASVSGAQAGSLFGLHLAG